MQRFASILKKLWPLAMKCRVRESRLISINEDEGKSLRLVSLRFIRSIAVNRAQNKHSALDRMVGM